MKTKFIALLAWVCAMSGVLAQATVSLREVVTNTEKNGMVLLNQGYRGKFTKILGDTNEPLKTLLDFEFSHGWLYARVAPGEMQPSQKIAVGILSPANRDVKAFREVSNYCPSIPDFKRLSELGKIEEFVKIFGHPELSTSPWKFDGNVAFSTWSWKAFTIQDDMTLRVVNVTLTLGKSAVESKIEKKCIKEGVFHATGKSPVLENPENKEIEQGGRGDGDKPLK